MSEQSSSQDTWYREVFQQYLDANRFRYLTLVRRMADELARPDSFPWHDQPQSQPSMLRDAVARAMKKLRALSRVAEPEQEPVQPPIVQESIVIRGQWLIVDEDGTIREPESSEREENTNE